jgi:hypothetical protein
MPRFEVNKVVVTDRPEVIVEPGLEAGDHLFQLVVVDTDNNESLPDVQRIRINPLIR